MNMDCCGNYTDFPYRSINTNIGNGMAGVSLGGSPSYFGHHYPSMKYQQSPHLSLYRLGGPTRYNGIGPPSIPAVPHAMYGSYDRYAGYPNISPYGLNSNGYNYSNLSVRDLSGYYHPYENYNRAVTHPYHAVHRSQYDPNVYSGRNANSLYQAYSYNSQTSREYHHGSSNLYMQPPSHHSLHQIGASRDLYTPRIPCATPTHPIESERSDGDFDRMQFSSEMTSTPSPHSNVSSNRVPVHNNNRLMHNDYSPHAESSLYMTSNNPSTTDMQQLNLTQQHERSSELQHQEHQHLHHKISLISPQNSTEFVEVSKEVKSRKPAKEKEKQSERFGTNRKLSTSIASNNNKSERCSTPFVTNQKNYRSSPVNLSPRLQNGYLSSNQISPVTSQWSPKQRKNHTSTSIMSKSKVLECDFIPSKKSKRKTAVGTKDDAPDSREEVKNITPLPGFQQAFGSTEIGRFSETFFNTPESPLDIPYESEADTLSPQPWETGDSLEGPHYNLHIGASVQPLHSSNNSSIDSPVDNNCFSEINCSNY